MRGRSQRAASTLSTPSVEAWSVTAATMGIGSSVSSKTTTSQPVEVASGNRRLQNMVACMPSLVRAR